MKDLKKTTNFSEMTFIGDMTDEDLASLLEYLCNSIDVMRKYQSLPGVSKVTDNIMMLEFEIFEEMKSRLTSPSDNDD